MSSEQIASTEWVKAQIDEASKPTHAVLYTDGGCKPSRGVGGWGVHGYFFLEEPATQGTGCPTALPTKDGYKMGASGKPDITLTHYVNGFGSLDPDSTNNQAELTAAIRAMEIAEEYGIQDVLLIMDSELTLKGLTEWMSGWAANNWIKADQTEVKNATLWKRAHELKTQLEAAGVKIRGRWVKGHSGALGNELADQLANRGIIAGRNGSAMEVVKVDAAKGYWSNKNPRNRLFSHPNWYFGTQSDDQGISPDGRHVYYLGDPREDDELLGKKIADATFSVLYLKEPEAVLATVRNAVKNMGAGQYQGLSIGHLEKIFHPETYAEIQAYGDKLLVKDYQRQRLFSPTDAILTKEIRPARLAYHAVDALQALEQLLQEHLVPQPNTRLRSTDITDILYEVDTSKKKPVYKLKSHITSAVRSIQVDASYARGPDESGMATITLTLGLDLPDRNTLAALAGETTKVTLLTWPESAHAIRYATVLEADGDAGIWSGIYANLHMLAS